MSFHSLLFLLIDPILHQDHINSLLKDRWYALPYDEKHVWEEWEIWDAKRFQHQCEVYENRRMGTKKAPVIKDGFSLPKKSLNEEKGGVLHVPKKRK